jgi:hypothetical protein
MIHNSSDAIQISGKDLIAGSGGPTTFQQWDEHLLGIVAHSIVELNDAGGTNAYYAAEFVCEEHPDLESRWGREYIQELTQSLMAADIVSLSKHFTELFAEFNTRFFGNRLPPYDVRVVFNLHIVAKEPILMRSVSSGLVRFDERSIYIRYTEPTSMTGTLVHEMAHAVTSGAHDERWLEEMKRLKEAGAPVHDADLEPL